MTIRQARALTTVLKFGNPLQIEAKRVMELGAEIAELNNEMYWRYNVRDMEEKLMLEMLEVLRNT